MLNMCKAKLPSKMRISLRLDDLKCAFSVKSAKLMVHTLDENLNVGMKAHAGNSPTCHEDPPNRHHNQYPTRRTRAASPCK